MLIDTHCHLDFKDFEADRDKVIDRAKASGVGLILNVASSLEGSRNSIALAEKYDLIYASVGIHPHDAEKVNAAALKELEGMASHKKVVAIGEVGLDYYRALSPRDVQRKVFSEFISLAKKTNLPLILHNRDSHQDMLDILKDGFKDKKPKGVMHCFSGDERFLKKCLDMGLYISFTCNLTFKSAERLKGVAKQVPTEKLLLETDAPFLAPQAYRGKRNEPAHIVLLVEELSKIHNLSMEDIERITTRNAVELFSLKEAGPARIAYEIRDSLYLNITNRCTNECGFCVRSFSDFVKGHNLKLAKEPSTKEILNAIEKMGKYNKIVFCGFGEPTLRLDVIKEVAASLKQRSKKVRLVTNGHGNLINGRSIAEELKGLVDKVSVSLNVDTKEKYNKVCRSQFGENTFEEVKRFIRECKTAGLEVEVTCLDIPETDIERCRVIAEKELGANFRLRRHNVVG
ncbi:MAG: YchF/TatD family DNA exonuclease [Candidatus Omnitrophica bacterium]|nr:YchF/TatD family DNA exonuclease [Candidatus Omnitrophota bacterium]